MLLLLLLLLLFFRAGLFKNEREREEREREKRERKEREKTNESVFFFLSSSRKKRLIGGTFSFFFFFFLSIISRLFVHVLCSLYKFTRVCITRNKRDEKRPDERDETRRGDGGLSVPLRWRRLFFVLFFTTTTTSETNEKNKERE